MKKILAVVLFSLSVSPLLAADAAAPAAAAPDAAAPAAAAPAAPAATAPKAKKAPKAGDEAGIKKAMKEFSEAWAAGDAKALAAHFTPDGSLINPFGQQAWGKAEVEKLIAGDLEMMKGSTQTFDDYKFHFVLPGCALVDATATLSGMKNADGTAAADKQFHVYAVLALRGSKWLALSVRPYAFVNQGGAAPAAAPAASAPPAAAAPAGAAPAEKAAVPATK